MDSQEGFGSLIPENINKKLHNGGVQFSELRQAGKTPDNLIETIYRFGAEEVSVLSETGMDYWMKRK